MVNKQEKQAPALWDDTGSVRLDGCAAVNPGPQTPYKGAACPVKELKGQREYLGGPPVVRVRGDWD